jgi:hypothetical protein
MIRAPIVLVAMLAAMIGPVAAASPQTDGSVAEAARQLAPGAFLWAPDVAPQGPVMLIVSIGAQRAVLYRNGIPIGITTVSTGRRGHATPTGVFTVLERRIEHYSSLYDGAPMPYMQRLTWGGVALHGGTLPGYPASHGCIRMPQEFARLLYSVTRLGMTVIVIRNAALPRLAPREQLLGNEDVPIGSGETVWRPEAAPDGPISIVISIADERLVVLRAGALIGSVPARVDAQLARPLAFMRRDDGAGEPAWVQIDLPLPGVDTPSPDLHGRVHVDPVFRARLDPLLVPGTTVVVTADSFRQENIP